MLRTAQAQRTIEPTKPVTVLIFYGCRIEPGQWRRARGSIVRIVEATPSVRLLPRPGMAPYVAIRQSVSPFRDVRNAHEAVRSVTNRFCLQDVAGWDRILERLLVETGLMVTDPAWALVTRFDPEAEPNYTRLLLRLLG